MSNTVPATSETERPLLRGWSHAIAAAVAAAGSIALVVLSSGSSSKRIALGVYGLTLVALLAVSATYHLRRWPSRAQSWLRAVDHANIFLVIAGTYTPIALLLSDDRLRAGLLVSIWLCAAIGIATIRLSLGASRGKAAAIYVAMGWLGLAMLPQLAAVAGARVFLLLSGGIVYSLGALAYATRRPRLWPSVFGFHEVSHLAVIGASVLFYAFIATVVSGSSS